MKLKNIITVVLVVFVVASVAYLFSKDSGTISENETPAPAETAVSPSHKVMAYYFHGDKRCKTCLHIEASAKQAIEATFPEELKDGRLEWKLVNFDDAANAEMATHYEIVASSLVIVEFRDGQETQWQTLERVWELVGDEEPFAAYVVEEVKKYLQPDKNDG